MARIMVVTQSMIECDNYNCSDGYHFPDVEGHFHVLKGSVQGPFDMSIDAVHSASHARAVAE